jgi:hypothetical protein
MATDNSRHKADSGKKYSLNFDLLHDKIEHYQVEACHIYNMDEKGFMLEVIGCSKIFSVGSCTRFEKGGVLSRMALESG